MTSRDITTSRPIELRGTVSVRPRGSHPVDHPATLWTADLLVAVACAARLAAGISLAWLAAAVCIVLVGTALGGARVTGWSRKPLANVVVQLTRSGLIATTFLLAARSLSPSGPDAVHLLLLGTVTTAALVVSRVILHAGARSAYRRGAGAVPTIIVGAGVIGRQLARRMRKHPELGFLPTGFLDDDPPNGLTGLDGVPLLGAEADLLDAIERTGARHVVFAFSRAPDSEMLPLLRLCQRAQIDVSVMPRLFENVNGRVRVEQLAGLPLLALHQTDPRSWQFAVKHASDRVVAALLLTVLAPLFGLVALAVRLTSRGPVFFRQVRVGRDGRPFTLLKFRSMHGTAPAVAAPLLARLDDDDLGPGGIEGDDRRTLLGALLRRSGLDELPQLINVLRGEMSLVGPRPERPDLAGRFGTRIRRYSDRHLVRSGITGWAQVNGLRGRTSMSERIEWDNWYIQNWSLWLDLRTIIRTPLAILRTPPEDAEPTEADDA